MKTLHGPLTQRKLLVLIRNSDFITTRHQRALFNFKKSTYLLFSLMGIYYTNKLSSHNFETEYFSEY